MQLLGILEDRKTLALLLAFVAGFVDTATFLGADGIFSAHVTGNFVVFAANIASDEPAAWWKLLTFPFFALGVMVIGYCGGRKILKLKSSLFLLSLLLLIGGFQIPHAVFLIVVAMGIQNAIHKVFLTGPTSTVMTGNVTQVFLESLSINKSPIFFTTIKMIFGFLVGCVSGAFAVKSYGMISMVMPAVLISVMAMLEKKEGPKAL